MPGRTRRPRALGVLPVVVGLALSGVLGTASAVAVRGPVVPPATASAGLRPSVEPLPALDAAPGEPAAATPAAGPSSTPAARPAPSTSAAAPGPGPSPSAVRPLTALRAPDLLVEVSGGLTPAQLAALEDVQGVQALTALDVGTVEVAGARSRVAGVDPSSFRAFTPQETAASDPLWQSVARGELATSYGLLRARGLELGQDVAVAGAARVQERLGAVAAFAVPEVDLVVSRDVARRLGATRSAAVLVSAPERSIARLRRAVLAVTGEAEVTVLRPVAVPRRTGGPRSYRELYIASARYCPGLSWTVLASIGQIESGHGRNLGPSSAGALGPMQFMPATWASYGVDGDGDGDADVMDPLDAVPAASLYLCRHGAGRGADGLYDAVFAYNHADWYVRKVLALAEQYRRGG